MSTFFAAMFEQGVPVPLTFNPLDLVIDFPLPPRVPNHALAVTDDDALSTAEGFEFPVIAGPCSPRGHQRGTAPRIVHPSPPDVRTPKTLLRTRAVARLARTPPSISANGGAYDFGAIAAYLPVPIQWWVSKSDPQSRCLAAFVFVVAGDLCAGEGLEEQAMFHWASPESGCRLLFAHWRIIEVVDATLRRCGVDPSAKWDADGAFFDASGNLKMDDLETVEKIGFVRRNQPVSRPSVLRSTYGGIGVPFLMRDVSLRRTDADAVQATRDTRHFYELTEDATAVCRVEYENGKWPPQMGGRALGNAGADTDDDDGSSSGEEAATDRQRQAKRAKTQPRATQSNPTATGTERVPPSEDSMESVESYLCI